LVFCAAEIFRSPFFLLDDKRHDRAAHVPRRAFIAAHLASGMGRDHSGRRRMGILYAQAHRRVPEKPSVHHLVV
jgi:hypothetical protein